MDHIFHHSLKIVGLSIQSLPLCWIAGSTACFRSYQYIHSVSKFAATERRKRWVSEGCGATHSAQDSDGSLGMDSVWAGESKMLSYMVFLHFCINLFWIMNINEVIISRLYSGYAQHGADLDDLSRCALPCKWSSDWTTFNWNEPYNLNWNLFRNNQISVSTIHDVV